MSDVKHILISNDDGIDAAGLLALEAAMKSLPNVRVTVVAPNDQQSASSHSLTLNGPLRIIERGEGRYAVTGTPTDTVLVAMEKILLNDRPDIVVSGINHGPNMGEDVIYSGTVAAAMEGTMLDIPSLAISHEAWSPTDFEPAARFMRNCFNDIISAPFEKGSLLNINIPDRPYEDIKGIRTTRLGSREYHDVITDQVDPHGKPYVWIGGHGPTWVHMDGTDSTAIEDGYVSITPLQVDLTHYRLLQQMQGLQRDGLPKD